MCAGCGGSPGLQAPAAHYPQSAASPCLLGECSAWAPPAEARCHASAHPTCPPAASGLLQFPLTADELHNTYYLVRAGESQAESEGYILTNPVAKTSMTAGLSKQGKRQVRVLWGTAGAGVAAAQGRCGVKEGGSNVWCGCRAQVPMAWGEGAGGHGTGATCR